MTQQSKYSLFMTSTTTSMAANTTTTTMNMALKRRIFYIMFLFVSSIVLETTSFQSFSTSSLLLPSTKFSPPTKPHSFTTFTSAKTSSTRTTTTTTTSFPLQATPLNSNAPPPPPPPKQAVKEKKEQELLFIQTALRRQALFQNLSNDSLQKLVTSFERIIPDIQPGQIICQQGDSCSNTENDENNNNYYVYLVGPNSEFKVIVDNVQLPEPYGILSEGSIFGELGIVYQENRSATIIAKGITTPPQPPTPPSTKSSNTTDTGTTMPQHQEQEQQPPILLYRINGTIFKSILNPSTKELQYMKEIDVAINQVEGGINSLYYDGDIIPQFKPQRIWLWKQYTGTILNISLQTTIINMIVSILFIFFAKQQQQQPYDQSQFFSLLDDSITTHTSIQDMFTSFFTSFSSSSSSSSSSSIVPDPTNNPFIQRLSLVHEVWVYQQTLTTFTLTFFLNQSYSVWKEIYFLARTIQSHLCDYHLLVATNVKRNQQTGTLLPESEQLLDDIGQYSRLYHIFMWSSLAKRFDVLTTPLGLERLESRGVMTLSQLQVLQSLNLPKDQLHTAPLEWMMMRINQAMADGTLSSDPVTKGVFLQQTIKLRETFSDIEDKLAGRMPLAYAHLVQILVDTYVLTAPIALYSDLGDYSVCAVGIITLSFTGFLNLSKIFLDPLNNENFCNNSIFMDLGVLIRESNAQSVQWKNSGNTLPLQ